MGAGLHRPSSRFLHRADPATKLIALTAWFVVALLLAGPVALAALAGLVLLAAACAGLLGVLARFGRFMAVMFTMCTILWWVFSREASGLGKGLVMGLRLTTMLAMGLLFLASTRVEEITAGLRRLGVPFMGAFSLTLVFRLMPLFTVSAATVVQAQRCRGLEVRHGHLLARLRSYLPLLVPLVLSSLRTADALAAALEARGLGMLARRTSLIQGRFGAGEALLAGLSVGAASGLAALRAAGVVL